MRLGTTMKTQVSIKSFPSINIREVMKHRQHVDPVLGSGSVRLYASGRSALFHVFKSLNSGAGDTVLLPSFHCGVEVEAALRAGFEVGFYAVDKNLSLDLKDLLGGINVRTKAIVVVHYFGFPQEISSLRNVCRDKGIMLIEDCAHALYSQSSDGKWLGTKGDFAVFSMRKTVFLPNGGAVLVNNTDAALPGVAKKHFELAVVKSTIKSILEHELKRGGVFSVFSRFVLAVFEKRNKGGKYTEEPEETGDNRWYYDVPLYHYENDISAISRLFWGNEDFRNIIICRRKNYRRIEQRLKSRLKEVFVFPELPEGVCPLCFPIFVEQRDVIVSKLNERGIEMFVFGRLLHPMVRDNAFPAARYLADSIMGLPVHQQLSDQEIDTLSNVLIDTLEGSKQS